MTNPRDYQNPKDSQAQKQAPLAPKQNQNEKSRDAQKGRGE